MPDGIWSGRAGATRVFECPSKQRISCATVQTQYEGLYSVVHICLEHTCFTQRANFHTDTHAFVSVYAHAYLVCIACVCVCVCVYVFLYAYIHVYVHVRVRDVHVEVHVDVDVCSVRLRDLVVDMATAVTMLMTINTVEPTLTNKS